MLCLTSESQKYWTGGLVGGPGLSARKNNYIKNSRTLRKEGLMNSQGQITLDLLLPLLGVDQRNAAHKVFQF